MRVRWLNQENPAARPAAYVPPPVPAGHVRVRLECSQYDMEAQWTEWKPAETERVPEDLFDLPAEQVERWERAYKAFHEAEGEINELIGQRGHAVPPGWEPAP